MLRWTWAIKGASPIVLRGEARDWGKGCGHGAGARRGVDLVINDTHQARGVRGELAEEIRKKTGVKGERRFAVESRPMRQRAGARPACPEPDIIVNNCGGTADRRLRDWKRGRMGSRRSTPTL